MSECKVSGCHYYQTKCISCGERYRRDSFHTSEWISVKQIGKPSQDCTCYVTNSRANCDCFLALYRKEYDVFVLYDPKQYHHPAIDVTHYVILPYPKLDAEE